jgi:hypothetical protein
LVENKTEAHEWDLLEDTFVLNGDLRIHCSLQQNNRLSIIRYCKQLKVYKKLLVFGLTSDLIKWFNNYIKLAAMSCYTRNFDGVFLKAV